MHLELPGRDPKPFDNELATDLTWIRTLQTAVGKPTTILDVGSGDTHVLEAMRSVFGTRVVGLDLDHHKLIQLRKKTGVTTSINADVARLPIRSGQIELLTCSKTFHYLEEPRTFLDEAFRVIKPGGVLAIRSFTQEYVERLFMAHYFPSYADAVRPHIPQTSAIVGEAQDSGFIYDRIIETRNLEYESIDEAILNTEIDYTLIRMVGREEFVAGLEKMREAKSAGYTGPMFSAIPLLVFRKPA